MKKVLILALLPVFLFSIIGWQWMFAIQIYKHQLTEWRADYDEQNLEVITVKAGDGRKDTYILNSHELFHHGKFFDIRYKKKNGTETIYFCHADNEEGKLFTSLDSKLKDEQDHSTSAKQKLMKVVKVSVFEEDQCRIFMVSQDICEMNLLYRTPFSALIDDNPVFVPPDARVLIS